ncbi:MAG: hypothetical protein WD768_20615 [Phycisphaeraceae bacterium]
MPALKLETRTDEAAVVDGSVVNDKIASHAVNVLAAREAAFNEMDQPLKEVAKKLTHLEGLGSVSMLAVTWEQGKLVLQVLEEEVAYGSNAVKKLAEYLGVSESRLYALRTIAVTFKREDMKALGHREMANGERITRGHLLELAVVRSKRDRNKLIEAIFKESLSVRDLAARISEKFVPAPKAHRNGRKPKTPSSPAAGIEDMTRVANSVSNKVEIWVKAVFDELDEAEPDRFTDAMVSKMAESLKSVETMESGIAMVKNRLAKNLERARKVLNLRGPKQEQETESAEVGKRKPRRISRQPGGKA